MNDPLNTQIAGKHYKDLAIQPVEFCMVNHYDFCASSVVKYVSRHRSKNGRQDIEKAIHFVELRMELTSGVGIIERMVTWLRGEFGCGRWRRNNGFTIPMGEYVEKNELGASESAALLALEAWLTNGEQEDCTDLLTGLNAILMQYDSEAWRILADQHGLSAGGDC